MLLWRDRDRIARRLCEIDAALAAIAGRLDADRPHLRAPRPNASASALAADFMALQSIDRRRAGDAADALRLSTEAETLAEAAGVLLAELPSEELAGESPEQTSLEAAAAAAERSNLAMTLSITEQSLSTITQALLSRVWSAVVWALTT